MACQLPVMPLYVDSLGGTTDQIGIVMGSFAIGLLLFRPYLGREADRRGRVKVMRLGLVVATVMPCCYALFPAIPLLIAFRAIHGISIASFTTGYSALVADLAPAGQRGEIVGYMSLVNPLGLAIGPALGGWIQAGFGYQVLFHTASVLGGLGLWLTLYLRENCRSAPEAGAKSAKLWQIWWHPRVRIPTVVLLLVGLSFGTLSAFMPLFLKRQGIPINAGLFYLSAAIAGLLVRLPLASWSDRLGRGIFVSVGIICYALSMALMYGAQHPLTVLLSGMIEGMGAGLVIPSIITIIADRTTPQERGLVFGLVWSGFDLGIALAGPTVGVVIRQAELNHAFAIATGLCLVGLGIFLTQSSGNVSASWRFATGRGRDVWSITT
jgi:Arabinose efflux permease